MVKTIVIYYKAVSAVLNSVFHRILDYNRGGFLSGPFFLIHSHEPAWRQTGYTNYTNFREGKIATDSTDFHRLKENT